MVTSFQNNNPKLFWHLRGVQRWPRWQGLLYIHSWLFEHYLGRLAIGYRGYQHNFHNLPHSSDRMGAPSWLRHRRVQSSLERLGWDFSIDDARY